MSRDEIMQMIKDNLADILEIDADSVDPSQSMKDAGASSLDIVEVVSLTMRQLKIKVPRTELSKLNNMDELVDLFHEALVEKQTV